MYKLGFLAFALYTLIRTGNCFGKTMEAIKRIRRRIEANPQESASQIFAALMVALESEAPFKLSRLYQLGFDDFKEALKLIDEWRLDRHYSTKYGLLDASMFSDDAG